MTSETTTELWCVHVTGPDDVMAMPDKATAEAEAEKLTALFADIAVGKGEHWPRMAAVVEPWPWSAEAHAAELAKDSS